MQDRWSTIAELRPAIAGGTLSPLQLVEQALADAVSYADRNAFAFIDAERARAEAAERSREAAAGCFRGPLHGVPVTVKDLFNVDGMPTRAGTEAPLPVALGSSQASAVARLCAAGAIVLGKTNMVEIALGITGENSWTGDVKHPLDPARQTGGSSSGSAAAVALGIGFASLGSDTGGSIRIPASFCGLTGFKPTLRRVSLAGALPLSPTCDHVGVLTRSVRDAHLVMDVLVNQAPSSTSIVPAAIRYGVPRTWLAGRLGIPVRQAFEAFIERLHRLGVSVVDVAPQDLALAATCFGPLVLAEAAHVHAAALAHHPNGFSPAVRELLRQGQQLDRATYEQAQQQRRLVAAGLAHTFRQVDLLLLPTAPTPAPLRGTTQLQLEAGRQDVTAALLALTVPFSLTGLPALSLPFAQVEQLPVGLQVVGPWGRDEHVLQVGAWLEELLRA